MTTDHYAGAAAGWASGASLVFGPISVRLVNMSPQPLAGRVVLDVGAGTGLASAALVARGARPVAVDLSHDMLSWQAASRPPAAVGDVRSIPIASRSVDGAVAAFVLNHLLDPEVGLAEVVRVTRPGGPVLASAYSTSSSSPARDVVDESVRASGWTVPDWYIQVRTRATPLVGTADNMARVAHAAGLVGITVDEQAVDVGVVDAEQLVRYRLGHAQFSGWLEQIGPDRREEARQRAVEAVRPIMEPYRPVVVFLAALAPLRGLQGDASSGGTTSGPKRRISPNRSS